MNDIFWVYRNQYLVVRINSEVVSDWLKNRQVDLYKGEQFGVLIGASSEDYNNVWIEKISEPYAGDQSLPYSFTLKDPGHQNLVNQSYNESNGKLGYLGTWHTHPEAIPKPSYVDLNDWKKCIKRNPDRSLVFVIVGIESISVFSGVAGKIHQMNFEEG